MRADTDTLWRVGIYRGSNPDNKGLLALRAQSGRFCLHQFTGLANLASILVQ